MRTLHCSSTSFGYMKPSTPAIIASLPLSHSAVQVLVVDLGLGSHVRLQYLDLVVAQDFVHRVLGVLEIHQQARPGRAVFATRRGEPPRDAVVTERAFVHRLLLRMQVAATVRAGLHAVAAAQAIG